MTKRQKYYLLQKLMGVFFIAAGFAVYALEWDATMLVVGIPLGLSLICSKKPLVINKLYFEMGEERDRDRKSR